MISSKAAVLLALVVASVQADVYIHGCIRGSNNRNCRNDNNDRRRNANRLFDSQNNDKGGYSCPRAYPFSAANNGNTATVDKYGKISGNNVIDTPTFYVYGGSVVNMEWTNQHGAGGNPNLYGQAIWQYMTDSTNPLLRDGTPITNNDGDNNNDEATGTITAATVEDGRYGYHETLASYQKCQTTSRNKGLFIADQNLNGNTARFTRQNPNAQTYGFECAEERDYYPYWRPSEWHDIAIYTKDLDRCRTKIAPLSQNVVSKCECILATATANNPAPITQRGCDEASGTWTCAQPWSATKNCGYGKDTWACDAEPQCIQAPYSRDNHLGNQVAADGVTGVDDKTVNAATFTWKVPEFLRETKVVLRVRYNVSTYDFDMDTTDSRFNGANSPVIDRDNREELSYYDVGLTPSGATKPDVYKLGLAVNTDQYARTFQDRTYVFVVKPLPSSLEDCRGRLYNVNMRGKRGNIVQVYPSVEYDFCPQQMTVTQDDCLHIQWTGSDYNPNRNPNDAEGGPYNPNNQNEAKADRTNLVQMAQVGANQPMHANNMTKNNCFFVDSNGNCDWTTYRRMAFIDQDMSTCLTVAELKAAGVNNRQQRERDPRNCGKLSAAKTPYFDGGVQVVRAKEGSYYFYSTRNNNFSNRSQKLKIAVQAKQSSGSSLSAGQKAGIAIGVLAGVGIAGAGAFVFWRKRNAGLAGRAPAYKAAAAPARSKPMI